MTHSIDFKGIEERLFLLQQMALGSRAYCEERGICRRPFPQGSGGWLDYSGALQQLVSTYTIECAVKTRVVQDFIAASPRPVEMKRLEAEAIAGFALGIVHEGTFELSLRESCNKIIHATSVDLGWKKARLRNPSRQVEYWNGSLHLRGKQSKRPWHVELSVIDWAIGMENLHALLDDGTDWHAVYGLND